MNTTPIEWCDVTWNPVTGCLKGCAYCYAARHVKRFAPDARSSMGGVELLKPQRGADGKAQPWPVGFHPTLHRYRLDEPLLEQKPKRIFVVSMGDLMGSWVPAHWVRLVVEVAEACPQHEFLFLTKNPARYAEFNPWPQNAWLGATATNQAELDVALAGLATADAWPKFLSCEPLRGELVLPDGVDHVVDWLIIGAQTGAGAVAPRSRWVTSLTMQACEAGLCVFHKDNLKVEGPRLRQTPGTASVRARAEREVGHG